jgi:hypothetical protein
MTAGVMIFAFDSDHISYTTLARNLARRIARHLDLPVSVITDQSELQQCTEFDHVIMAESAQNGIRNQVPWKNLDRYRAYELSPYDQTLMLDADYLVCSDRLKILFDQDQDFLPMPRAFDVTSRRDYSDLNFFGRHNMPSAWATVMYWRRSRTAEMIFGMMRMIQHNWAHYRDLFGISERRFRNDYAVAIACNTIMGHLGHWPAIPWPLANIESDCELNQLGPDSFSVGYHDQQGRSKHLILTGQDFHAMDKLCLGALSDH